MSSGDLPGVGQVAPLSRLPAGAVARGGWIEPKEVPVVLAKVNTSGTSRTSASVAARVDIPAGRLIVGVSVGFEPATAQAFTNFASAVWSATAIRPRIDGGKEARLHSIFAGRALPEQWEVTTTVRSILIEATVTVPLTAASAAIEGEWVLMAVFEPAIPMCEEEVAAIYSRCGARQTLFASGPLAP